MPQKSGAGALIISSKTGRVCLTMRAPHKHQKLTWALWGGMMEEGETPKVALLRELEEEMGFVPTIDKIYPFDIYESKDGEFRYYTFVCIVGDEFVPIINGEASGYGWFTLGVWPKPMHQGAKQSLCTKKAQALLEIILGQHSPTEGQQR